MVFGWWEGQNPDFPYVYKGNPGFDLPTQKHLPIELGYFCSALSNRLIEIYKLVHLKNSKIYVFGDFRPDLGPKSTILALRQAPKSTPQNRNFFELPITLAYFHGYRSFGFSQLYKVVYLNFPPFGSIGQIMADAPNPPKSPISFARFCAGIATTGGPLNQG